ncbi:MAG: hypothetical protein A2289_18210 [Deltaproteobacteria bacterium RIFOXYA12_FULL_58_15]|nr:MAG: hypothetical protein A2289_18210 [Deltaproteobacteria bacterium RIFOXYA12_FULL_58_15]
MRSYHVLLCTGCSLFLCSCSTGNVTFDGDSPAPGDLAPGDLVVGDSGPGDVSVGDAGAGGDASLGDRDGGDSPSGDFAVGDQGFGGDSVSPVRLPSSLPFDYSRPAVGVPPSPEEITHFTRTVTGLWRDLDFFRWVDAYSHGLHRDFDPLGLGFKLWWQDVRMVRAGDTVRMEHIGGSDNQMIRTSKLLVQAASGYLLIGDEVMKGLVEQYANGIVALCLAMAWGNDDPPVETIMARGLFTYDHEYTTDWGDNVAVSYEEVRHEVVDTHAETIPNSDNPTWGSIWVRAQRSKDDLPYLYLADAMLLRIIEETADVSLRTAAQRAHNSIVGFTRDIVDHGYKIRTRDKFGSIYVPDGDLASFTYYDLLLANAECNKKLSTALVAYGAPLENVCGDGINVLYDTIVVNSNWFNERMIRYYHMAAVEHALLVGQNDVARELLTGIASRSVAMFADNSTRDEQPEFDSYGAVFLLTAAAVGLPLTAQEARWIQREYSEAAAFLPAQPQFHLWDEDGVDGEYSYKITTEADGVGYVRPEDIAELLHYCYSPWRNPSGVSFVDCDVVADPSRWGL